MGSDIKRVLITGANSYIGTSFEDYAGKHYLNLIIETIDMIGDEWKREDFSIYDTVFHVAGIAHADVGHVDEDTKARYYAVNTDLAIETARKAKNEGVNQFIFMSSMIIYGDSAPCGKHKVINKDTKPSPSNFYGDSKWKADKGVRDLETDRFQVAVLRPPMIYGKGSKGNYPSLAKLAKKLPVFPDVYNQRSMLYIENLCELLCQLVVSGRGGVFFPQNSEYTRTSEMVREIGEAANRPVHLTKLLNPLVYFASKLPGRFGGMTNKAFGNNVYSLELSQCDDFDYQRIDFEDSIALTERMEL